MALLKRLEQHVDAFKKIAALPPGERGSHSKAVWREWARDVEVALEALRGGVDMDGGCTCALIRYADKTRHFRGCPLRDKYPTHEAEKVVNEVNLDVARERNALLEEVQRLRGNMPGPIVMEFLAWLRTYGESYEDLWRNEDETICAEFFAQRIEAKEKAVHWKKEPRCGIGGCTLHPGHPGGHGSYLMRDGRDMGPVLRPEAYKKVDPGCPVHGSGLRIGPVHVDHGEGMRWTTEATCTCEAKGHSNPFHDTKLPSPEPVVLKSNAWSSADKAPPGAVPLKMPAATVPVDWDIEGLVATVKVLDERTALQSLHDANNVDAIRQLDTRLKQLDETTRREFSGAQNRDIALGERNADLAVRIVKLEAMVSGPPVRRGPTIEDKAAIEIPLPEDLSDKGLLKQAEDFVMRISEVPSRAVEELVDEFKTIRDRAKVRRRIMVGDLPEASWLRDELAKSLLCAKHHGQARCDCDEEKKKS